MPSLRRIPTTYRSLRRTSLGAFCFTILATFGAGSRSAKGRWCAATLALGRSRSRVQGHTIHGRRLALAQVTSVHTIRGDGQCNFHKFRMDHDGWLDRCLFVCPCIIKALKNDTCHKAYRQKVCNQGENGTLELHEMCQNCGRDIQTQIVFLRGRYNCNEVGSEFQRQARGWMHRSALLEGVDPLHGSKEHPALR